MLADTASLIAFHFSCRFKWDTGYSPVEYVNHKKLDYAKTLLIRTEWPVSEIAERTGFSLKGFIKLFSQAEGMSPLAWRRSRQLDMNRSEGPE